ncbi:MAG: hypothetical protein PVSMB1_18000 [Gemmatimonadaceae bacterium]
MNDWVKRASAGKMPTILNGISDSDVMFLINVIYFKGVWQNMFDKVATRDSSFTSLSGTKRPVPLMHQNTDLDYFADSHLQAVDLPYGNGAFAMTVILPTAGRNVNTLAIALTEAAWGWLLTKLREESVDLTLPKFKLACERHMNGDLTALGMGVAFQRGKADFTRMSPRGRDLFIGFVKQKTCVDVDEDGTEAVAVEDTAVLRSIHHRPSVTMRVDRPFILAIRERLSNTILFLGKIATLE